MTQPGNSHGGYRPPSKPAAVSGPGKMSKRTDGQPLATLPDAAYGEQKTFRNIQASAPMAQADGMASGGPGVSPLDMSRVVPFSEGSQFPGEPVTAGANAGLGPGQAALSRPDPSMRYAKSMLPTLEIAAAMPFASVEFRQMVRRLRAS